MPIVFEHQPDPNTRVAVWEITETRETLLALLPPLAPPEQLVFERMSFEPRQLEWLASRVLTHQLGQCYPAVSYNHSGQPTLTHPSLKISISHTRGYAAVAVSSSQIPGIDIEYPSSRIEKVAKRFINASETAFTSEQHKSAQLAIIWCAKEAIFKMAGRPGLIFKNDIILDPFVPQKTGKLTASLHIDNHSKPVRLEYRVTENYYLVYSAGILV